MYVNIRKLTKHEIIYDLSINDVGGSNLSPEEVEYLLIASDCLFDYNFALKVGNKNPPHALLPTGNHTNFYLWHDDMLNNSSLTDILASQLTKKLVFTDKLAKMSKRERYKSQIRFYIIGPSYSSFLVSSIARLCNCWQGITYDTDTFDQEWRSLPLYKDSSVQLICSYLMSDNILSVIKSAILENLNDNHQDILVKKEVGVVVNMLGQKITSKGWLINSLLDSRPTIWKADECLLCKAGSSVLSVQKNQLELTNCCWRKK